MVYLVQWLRYFCYICEALYPTLFQSSVVFASVAVLMLFSLFLLYMIVIVSIFQISEAPFTALFQWIVIFAIVALLISYFLYFFCNYVRYYCYINFVNPFSLLCFNDLLYNFARVVFYICCFRCSLLMIRYVFECNSLDDKFVISLFVILILC